MSGRWIYLTLLLALAITFVTARPDLIRARIRGRDLSKSRSLIEQETAVDAAKAHEDEDDDDDDDDDDEDTTEEVKDEDPMYTYLTTAAKAMEGVYDNLEPLSKGDDAEKYVEKKLNKGTSDLLLQLSWDMQEIWRAIYKFPVAKRQEIYLKVPVLQETLNACHPLDKPLKEAKKKSKELLKMKKSTRQKLFGDFLNFSKDTRAKLRDELIALEKEIMAVIPKLVIDMTKAKIAVLKAVRT